MTSGKLINRDETTRSLLAVKYPSIPFGKMTAMFGIGYFTPCRAEHTTICHNQLLTIYEFVDFISSCVDGYTKDLAKQLLADAVPSLAVIDRDFKRGVNKGTRNLTLRTCDMTEEERDAFIYHITGLHTYNELVYAGFRYACKEEWNSNLESRTDDDKLRRVKAYKWYVDSLPLFDSDANERMAKCSGVGLSEPEPEEYDLWKDSTPYDLFRCEMAFRCLEHSQANTLVILKQMIAMASRGKGVIDSAKICA
jgi:hypothetical protein